MAKLEISTRHPNEKKFCLVSMFAVKTNLIAGLLSLNRFQQPDCVESAACSNERARAQ